MPVPVNLCWEACKSIISKRFKTPCLPQDASHIGGMQRTVNDHASLSPSLNSALLQQLLAIVARRVFRNLNFII